MTDLAIVPRPRTETAGYGDPRPPFRPEPLMYPTYQPHGERDRAYLLDVAGAATTDSWPLSGDRVLVQDLCEDYCAVARQLEQEQLDHAATAGQLRAAEKELAASRKLAMEQANLHLAALEQTVRLSDQLARLSNASAVGVRIGIVMDRLMLSRVGMSCAQAMAADDLEERELRAIEAHARRADRGFIDADTVVVDEPDPVSVTADAADGAVE